MRKNFTSLPAGMSLVILAAALIVSPAGEARVYKCKDAQGNVSYSQTGCPSDQAQKKMHVPGGSGADAETCGFVGRAARDLMRRLRGGKASDEIIASHGGPNGINPRYLSVLTYVNGFRHHEDISLTRVGQLASAKCRGGGFGRITLNDLPGVDPGMAREMEMREIRKQQRQAVPKTQTAGGKHISVNFQNTPIKEAMAYISAQAGVPIVVDSGVTGRVTMRMVQVPWQLVVSQIAVQNKLLVGMDAAGGMRVAAP